jgi:hypothetical protein
LLPSLRVAVIQPGPSGTEGWQRPTPDATLGKARQPERRGGDLQPGCDPGYTERAWADDWAARGCDRSTDPGAKTGDSGRTPPLGIPGLAQMR